MQKGRQAKYAYCRSRLIAAVVEATQEVGVVLLTAELGEKDEEHARHEDERDEKEGRIDAERFACTFGGNRRQLLIYIYVPQVRRHV